MILRDITLKNFRNHRNTTLKFDPGITGIIGDNGTGKSSIIEAIQYLLVNELFEGTKEQAINLNATYGGVSGSFLLDKKVGYIERHLDVTKALLRYDGKEYKKSSEINEIWDKLLQLNPEIIKKVIIARQGEIPMLFSGDQSTREKIFQKIFMVPATEKLRNMVYTHYLKQAPPMVPEEDLLDLETSKTTAEAEIKALRLELEKKPIEEVVLDEMKTRLVFLRKCINDHSKLYLFQESLEETQAEQTTVAQQIAVINDKLKLISLEKLQECQAAMLQQRGLFKTKQRLENLLQKIEFPFSEDERENNLASLNVAKKTQEEEKDKLTLLKHDVKRLKKQSEMISEAETACCPLCHQSILQEELLKTLQSEVEEKEQQIQSVEQQLETVIQKELAYYRHNEFLYAEANQQQIQLQEQLKQFGSVSFDEATLTSVVKAIEKYHHLNDEQNELQLQVKEFQSKKQKIQFEINNLAVYKGDSTPQAEEQQLHAEISQNTEVVRNYQQKTVSLKVKEAELKTLIERIENTKENHERNQRRNKYVATLTKVYDVLHTSQFPRQLILRCSGDVTDYLQENLQLFNIPYNARVADNFKIELIDDQDRILPRVSGGQEIQVGISLHLALHDLFSQSFPLMIIDEGTTHLDSSNRKAYFDIIKGLKAKNKLKQIIVIDHDPMLSEVVDNVINLNEIKC